MAANYDGLVSLYSSCTWNLVPLPPSKVVIGCKWVYAIEIGPNGKIDYLKAHLVAIDYT